jgi:hypothetical protein
LAAALVAAIAAAALGIEIRLERSQMDRTHPFFLVMIVVRTL